MYQVRKVWGGIKGEYREVIPIAGSIHQLSKFTILYNVLVKVGFSQLSAPNNGVIYIREKWL